MAERSDRQQRNGNPPRQAPGQGQGQGQRVQKIEYVQQQQLPRIALQQQPPSYEHYDVNIPDYQGWVIRKCPSKELDPGMESSWKYCIPPSPMMISSKALVAEVKQRLAHYAKEKMTVQRAFDDLPSDHQRLQIESLIDEQNQILQETHPELEWVLETIEVDWITITWRSRKARAIKSFTGARCSVNEKTRTQPSTPTDSGPRPWSGP
ncbi:hypothetical protein AOQ84DRAFT_370680 [Glonium stellatum]|uniref:Uncharacterized protein n=1 Tax=Glonium stellatum TaxID=574774 RepID=A0A8E2FDC5_9PEZI|nr:hypothetical protein AOQ84DRAFT_370680 [Glonium stellatum]